MVTNRTRRHRSRMRQVVREWYGPALVVAVFGVLISVHGFGWKL